MTHEELLKGWETEENSAFSGWDFSHIDERSEEEALPWDYKDMVLRYLKPELLMLDMGTGGGEFLLSLEHPYINTSVTEAYEPNIELCMKKLVPLGITVRRITDDDVLPFDDEVFDIVINRHESFDTKEVARVLKPGGIFITQQVGEENNRKLSELLINDFKPSFITHNLISNQELLKDAGFSILEGNEFFPYLRFLDVGAIVYFAKIIEWEFPGFSVKRCFDKLLMLQKAIESCGYIESREHRFYIIAKKSDGDIGLL